jgi:GTP-binding protein
MILAANKMDLPDAKTKLAAFRKKAKNKKILPVSCATGEGIDALLDAALKLLTAGAGDEEPVITPVKKYVYEPEFAITKEDGVFIVQGKKVDTLAAMTEFGEEEALRRFQNILKKIGVEKALEENGIKEGDTVRIGDYEFVYEK